MTHDPVLIVELTEHDPAETIERLEAEGFVVSRECVDGALTSGYRVTGVIGDEGTISVPLPNAETLYARGGMACGVAGTPAARRRSVSVSASSAGIGP